MRQPWMRYLKTLRRVPDGVILAAATREFLMENGGSCVCGWVVREGLASIRGADAARIDGDDASNLAANKIYGGTEREWSDLYYDAANDYTIPDVERAFVERVKEAAGVA